MDSVKIVLRKEAEVNGLRLYYTGKPCKNGHIAQRYFPSSNCVECAVADGKIRNANQTDAQKQRRKERDARYLIENKEKRAKYYKEYAEKNKWKITEYQRQHYIKNKERIQPVRKEYREKNRDAARAWYKKHYEENKEKIQASREGYQKRYVEANKKEISRRKSKRYHSDIDFKLGSTIRTMVHRILRETDEKKEWRAKDRVGYSHFELKRHLESQFTEGMSWDNHGEWHIDHIKSVNSYIKEGVTDVAIINALSNLQPLWAYDNLSKGG